MQRIELWLASSSLSTALILGVCSGISFVAKLMQQKAGGCLWGWLDTMTRMYLHQISFCLLLYNKHNYFYQTSTTVMDALVVNKYQNFY